MKINAIIPARRGSKRLPGKNLMSFAGKPLIQWTIEQAKESLIFDEIYVYTNDEEIIDLSFKLGVCTIYDEGA